MTSDGRSIDIDAPRPVRQLVITGGWAHEFGRTAPHLVECAAKAGIRTDTIDDLDEAAMAWNLEYCISDLQLDGHYCLGNVAEFWSMTNE